MVICAPVRPEEIHWARSAMELVSNTAVAVRADVTYVAARNDTTGELLVVAEALLEAALGDGRRDVSGSLLQHKPGPLQRRPLRPSQDSR